MKYTIKPCDGLNSNNYIIYIIAPQAPVWYSPPWTPMFTGQPRRRNGEFPGSWKIYIRPGASKVQQIPFTGTVRERLHTSDIAYLNSFLYTYMTDCRALPNVSSSCTHTFAGRSYGTH